MEHETKFATEEQISKNRKQRKQPSEKVKHLQKTPKEKLLLPSAVADVALNEEVKNPPPSSLPQALSNPPEVCSSSVMLQDALLLVEAMDQSKTQSLPQEKLTSQGPCTPSVTLPSAVESPLPPPALVSQLPPTPKICDKSTKEESTNQAPSVTYTTNSSSSHAHIPVPIVHQKKTDVSSSSNTSTSLTPTAGKSLEQCAPHPQSVLADPLGTTIAPDLLPKKIFISDSPSTHPQETVVPLSQNQISAVISTVAAKSKDVTSDTAINSTDQRAHPTPSKKIKIIIHRATGILGSQPQMSETLVEPINQNSVVPAVTRSSQHPNTRAEVASDGKETPLSIEQITSVSSSQHCTRGGQVISQEKVSPLKPVEQITPLSSSQHQNSSAQGISQEKVKLLPPIQQTTPLSGSQQPNTGAELTSEEKKAPLPNDQIPPLEYLSQQTSNCESLGVTPREQTPALSTESIPGNRFPLVPVIRLKRLPYPPLSTGSFLVSQLSSHERESEVAPPDSTSSLTNRQVSKPTVGPTEVTPLTGKCSDLKETLVGGTTNASSKSEKVVPCSTLKAAPTTGLSPVTPSSVCEPILQQWKWKATMEFEKAALSDVSDQECESFTPDEEIIDGAEQGLVSPKGYSAPTVQLTPITKDLSAPRLHMTKTQFIAQLAMSPVIQESQKVLTNKSPNAQSSCEDSSNDGKRKLQKKSVIARLGIHMKKHSRTKRTKSKAQPPTDTECTPESPQKMRLENVRTAEQDSTLESTPVSTSIASSLSPEGQLTVVNLKNQLSTEISHPERKRTSGPVSVGSRTPVVSLCRLSLKDTRGRSSIMAPLPHTEINVVRGISAKYTLESGSLKSRDTIERIPINLEKPSTSVDCANKPFGSPVSPKSSSAKTCITLPAVIAGKLRKSRDEDSPNNVKVVPVYLRFNTTENTNTPLMAKSPPESRKRSLSPKENASVKKSHPDQPAHKKTSVSPSPTRTKLTSPQKSPLPLVSQKDTSSIKNGNSQSLRNCDFSQEERTSKRESSLSLGKTAFPSALVPKSPKKDASSSKTEEGSLKKSQANQMCTVREVNMKGESAKKLSTAATSNAEPKNKQPKLKKAKAVSKSHCGNETGEKCTSPRRVRVRAASQGEGAAAVGSPQPRCINGKRLLKNQCKDCGRVLSSSCALESHVSLHTGHRPYSCTLCRKSFPDAKGLNRHGRVHRNGRSHICQKCGKGFVYGFGLTKHLQMVHGKIKPFVCQICTKAFFTKRDVETHIRSHTGERPFHCHLCEKKFFRSVELNTHLRWHRGEKRHWCPYCGKGFFDQNNLKRHKYIHTGEKPHSCPHCPKHFTQSGHLKKHVKNVHKVQ
ncbi:mucin-17-like isoform X2 [Syngnathoides biaculeatus]|nr:mucin-17-like isoform X2 [Syngnathoides biaculeatus]